MAQDTRTRMLEKTATLLQHRGYYGTSLNDILKASAAPRGSLYFHFPGGKDQLVLEATRASAEIATAELRHLLDTCPSPANAVRAYAEGAAELMRQTDFTFGCPVAPVILDAAGNVPELEALCKATLEGWQALMRDAFIEAGIATARAPTLALMAVAAIEGALILARANRDSSPLETIAVELEALIDAALPR
jgi:TetR/AcrR family transcriptional repressor of lmrAB and yxaGH operons